MESCLSVINATHAYVATNAEGEPRAIVADDEFKKETAKSVAAWIKRGYTVERLPMDEARKRFAPPKGTSR